MRRGPDHWRPTPSVGRLLSAQAEKFSEKEKGGDDELMQMTPEEICRHFQLAKNKNNDIRVLADLNNTDRASIRAVLIEAGAMSPDPPPRHKAAKGEPPSVQRPESLEELAAAIRTGIGDGKTDKEIAAEVGCCRETVRNHRKRLGKQLNKFDGPAETISAQEADRGGPPPDFTIYTQLEAILGAIPADAGENTRRSAYDLCQILCRDYLARRLELEV